MRISDWSSDVCSSDLEIGADHQHRVRAKAGFCSPVDIPCRIARGLGWTGETGLGPEGVQIAAHHLTRRLSDLGRNLAARLCGRHSDLFGEEVCDRGGRQSIPQPGARSAEHKSVLKSLMPTSYSLFCLKNYTTTQS